MAERLNRTLQDKCRTMLIVAKIPGYLWGEVLEAANMLRNLTPVSNMICTPSEKWTVPKPDLSHIRAIGCKAFCQIDKGHRNGKFELVAYRGLLVNYSLSSDCYRVWDPIAVKVYNVGQPLFDETSVSGWWKQPKEDFDFPDC